MKQLVTFLTLITLSGNVFGQITYSGFIDKYPIELVTLTYSDGLAKAFYVYSKFDEPIKIDGTLKNGVLKLIERDSLGKARAILTFKNYAEESKAIEGTWKDNSTNKELKIRLSKAFAIDFGEMLEWKERDLLQPVSLKNYYFKITTSKNKGDFDARVTGIKLFEKKTDKLLQQITVDCQLWGLDNINVADYNFDGYPDFSVFEQSYAGPNTSSIYFLFNPTTNRYIKSTFTGSSLEFDQKTKRIYEHNQCCAGRGHMNAEYKVVNNKMVLVKKTCLEFDEKIDDFKKVKCE